MISQWASLVWLGWGGGADMFDILSTFCLRQLGANWAWNPLGFPKAHLLSRSLLKRDALIDFHKKWTVLGTRTRSGLFLLCLQPAPSS